MSADVRDVTSTIDDLTPLLTTIARASLHDRRVSDFSSILTASLAAAASNVGGPEALLAGRPGSWESAYISDLLRDAMGECPDQWWAVMTDAVTVNLNVAELIEDSDLHAGLAALDQAESRLDTAFEDHVKDGDGAYFRALTTLRKRYTDSYELYAERFAAAVRAIPMDLKLPVPPQVVAETDPQSAWWEESVIRNSAPDDSDLVHELWNGAHATVPLPAVDIVIDTAERVPA